tara:strand:- start:596 stop:796 length:201 start_codon:yes stop_codon:yes gene_type:complete
MKPNAQEILDSIPTPIKNILRRALYISASTLKGDLREMAGIGEEDQEVNNLLEAIDLIHDKLGRKW